VDALLAFAATLLALRLAGRLAARWRAARRPELAAWSAALAAYALASGALAWSTAAGWSTASFRAYYLFGGLLTAPLLGLGSLLLSGRRRALHVALVYVGVSFGIALAAPVSEPFPAEAIPVAGEHLPFFPARLVAILGNAAGTIAVVWIAVASLRRRPLGNLLIVSGVAVAALGTGLHLGPRLTGASVALAVLLLYAGFVAPSRRSVPQTDPRVVARDA
jgi:hypothetical protein